MFQEIHQSARAPKMENNWSYVWAHGDFIELHSDTLGLTISGRSDATLNPSGIRFGSAEIYNLIESLSAISDSLCVAQSNRSRTDERVLLFVKPVDIAGGDTALPKELEDQIRNVIRSQLSPRFIPAIIQSVPEIPYTANGKKVELAVRRLLEGQPPQKAFAKESLADPTVVDLYVHIAELIGQFD
ncbi:hypothetical protein CRM22_008923 [Opisthorchis felineus]|uniref:AMP-binding enzyme C-terminal domain-containing protein n=1 Tax=Opisthorchis felineus TaxID=147828 RepID=A0A4S2L9P3_OPIFE|nr:hypothetical protein CRM22_008923 [Opisthorchis felineus]